MRRYFPTLPEFTTAAGAGAIIPVYRQLLADHLTPVTAFEVLGREQHAFLLESVVGGEKIGRYSFIAAGPRWSTRSPAAKPRSRNSASPPREFTTTDPLADLQKLLPPEPFHPRQASPRLHRRPGRLRRLRHHPLLRRRKARLPSQDDRKLPDLLFGLYGELVIFDHVDKTIKVVANARIGPAGIEPAYRDACRRIDEIVSRLQQPPSSGLGEIDPHRAADSEIHRQLHPRAIRADGSRGQGIHQGRRHLPVRPQPATAREFSRPIRSTSTAPCGSSIPRRSCFI